MPLWLVISFIAIFLWAIRIFSDEVLSKGSESVFQNAKYGTVISGFFSIISVFFSIILLIVVPHEILYLRYADCIILFFAGSLYFCHTYFYFSLLQKRGVEASWVEVVGNLTLVALPFLGYVFLANALSWQILIGVIIVLFSVSIMLYKTRSLFVRYPSLVLLCLFFVLAFAFSTLFSEVAYNGYTFIEILVILGFFFLGVLVSNILYFIFFLSGDERRRIVFVTKSFWRVFLGLEIIDLLALLLFQLSIALAPSAVFVLASLQLIPLFIIIVGLIVLLFAYVFSNNRLRIAARRQLKFGPYKLIASILSVYAAFLILGSGL